MNRPRPVHLRHSSEPVSPMASSLHRHTRSSSSSLSNMKRPQNTKAAAQRLAQVMAHQAADDDEDEDDLMSDYDPMPATGLGLASGRSSRPRAPMSVRTPGEEHPPARLAYGARSSLTGSSVESQPVSSVRASGEQQPPARSAYGARSSLTGSSVEPQPVSSVRTSGEQQPPARSAYGSRSSLTVNSVEPQPLSAVRTLGEQQPPARSAYGARSSSTVSSVEPQPLSSVCTSGEQHSPARSAFSIRSSSTISSVEPQPLSSVRTSGEQQPPARSAFGARSSGTVSSVEHQSLPSVRTPSHLRPSHSKSTESLASAAVNSVDHQPSSARSPSYLRQSHSRSAETLQSPVAGHLSQLKDLVEEAEPPSARQSLIGRSSSFLPIMEQPSSARFSSSAGRPNVGVKPVSMVPPTVPMSLRSSVSVPTESPSEKTRDKRLSLDFGTFKFKEPSDQQSSSALQDEVDMLQEENDSLLEKLRLAEERVEEAEARTRQLEKQIASLGEGVSLEARLLSRKEAELQKREAALKVASQTYGGSNEELVALRVEAETARDEATSAFEQLHDVEGEVKSLRTLTQRMILTRRETEEVVLKRCWLARCWNLCIRHGIHAEIAGARCDYWSSLVSDPVAVILAAGQKAKDDTSFVNNDLEEREYVLLDQNEVTKKVNVESMLLVEKGLRELTSLKVEEAIAISMARTRRPNVIRSNLTDELRLPIDGQSTQEIYELSQDEIDDVLLKQAWLTYFWRRVKNNGLEPDIVDERLQFWISQMNKTPNSHDAVDVERGLMEMRKLGLETKLWEEVRRMIDPDSSQKTLLEIEFN